jgi:hypothetical protein
MHIPTGQKITRSRLTPVPLTKSFIDAMHNLAEQEGQPTSLKLQSKTGVILWDSAWIAGVHYDPESFETIDEQENDENENNYKPEEDD